ncbi:hypothetical protein [Desulfovibrio sp. JC010]|uniref:hypothetical protein n=1 Tax=Desulfovibrio sp. JC010 TaxID=2593641 RepID=UPI0013D0BC08|nr:hypothetical protein [Desulfovibrio sp. JC010]NDV28744.1 hypothetical protein [Desulfovibrio sp. JC010]
MVKQHRNNLFNDCELSVILENVYNSIIPQVEAIPEEEFLAASDSELIQRITEQNSVNQIILHEDKIRMSKPALCRLTPAGRIYRPENGQPPPDLKDGMITQVEIPYSGDKRLLVSRPSMHYRHGGPSFTIKEDRIIKYYVRPLYSDPKAFKDHFLRNYEKINKYLAWQDQDIAQFNKRLHKLAVIAVSKRRNRKRTVELHLDPKPDTAVFNPVNTRRKLKHNSAKNAKTEILVIPEKDFINAIRILRHTGNSFERTPDIYTVHNDQDLRNILVSNLNTHFTDNDNDDIFNRPGRIDFNISFADKSALTGKCFTWQCPEGLVYNLNELLDAEMWQSCKIALAIFNRTEPDFKKLLESIKQTFTGHACHVKIDKQMSENEWWTTMHPHRDLLRRHWVHIMVFNLFVKKERQPTYLNNEEREFFAKL